PRPRKGFALPTAILVISLVTIGLVASFSATGSEISNVASQRAQARAYSYAQYGLETFMARRAETNPTQFCPHCLAVNGTGSGAARTLAATLPAMQETLAVVIPMSPTNAATVGMAIVKSTPVMLDLVAGTGTYLITSTGYDSASTVYSNGKKRVGTRTVGVFATYSRSTMNVLAGWTSLSGIDIQGNAATISGIDACGSGNNVAGLSVPLKEGTTTADMTKNQNWDPVGNPAYDTTKTFSQESAAVKIDWASIQNGTAMPADIVIGSGTFPSDAAFAAAPDWFPVIHITNGTSGSDYRLPNAGRGTLIVDGDLTIDGSNQWNGIILVGGKITSNGNNVSSGATLSGLDYLIAGKPPASVAKQDNATANGQKTYVYNSCDVAKATSSQARYYIMPNSWMDNLAGY
ncbi:MAG: hypothetical protein ABIP93_04410, partial [Gemmatimonadaceae bacterium]